MVYQIKTSRSFEKDFARLDSLTQNRILGILERMKRDPFLGAKKLTNVEVGIFRIRVGDYRIRFDIVRKEIFLYRVRHRKEIYKN